MILAARLFNKRKGQSIEQIYGAVTTGNYWKFLSLKGDTAYINLKNYYIDRGGDIMGNWVGLVQPPMRVVTA